MLVKKVISSTILILALLLAVFGCTAKFEQAPSQPQNAQRISQGQSLKPGDDQISKPWEVEWGKTIAEAKKEGRVVVVSSGGASLKEAIIEGFNNAYGMTVEMLTSRGTQISAKVLAERRAGLYLGDVYLGGADQGMVMLKPAGVFDALEPALILPEVTDPVIIKELWLEGKLGWVDKDKTLLHFLYDISGGFLINKDFVKPEDFTSYRDLLNPKWKGKIIMMEPTRSGSGGKWAAIIGSQIMGWDYLLELVKQEPTIIADDSLLVNWIARGKYLIGTGASSELVQNMINVGVPLHEIAPKEGLYFGGGGTAHIALMNRAPHPNAARLFINWYLTKEAQTAHVRAVGNPSRRLDVSREGVNPFKIPKLGVKYLSTSSEEFILTLPKLFEKNQEIFGSLIK